MSVEYVTGDLFDFAGRAALGHGVNATGVMGSGIAPLFKRRWPAMFARYQHECRTGVLTLGGLMPWRDETTGQVIYNLATQHAPGPNADLTAVRSALNLTLAHAERVGVAALALPRIGAGIGGLAWDDVRTVIEELATDSPVAVTVVSLPRSR